MDKSELTIGLAAVLVVACAAAHTTTTTAASVPADVTVVRGSAPGAPAPSGCATPCDANISECNPVAHRCVGNGSPELNLCRWDTLGTGLALPCGKSEIVTTVNACRDPRNCGNCGIACPSGTCFWGECK